MALWCFIACFSLSYCLVSGEDAKYVLVGGKVEFQGFSNKEPPADILWKRIEGQLVHKVVQFDSREEQFFGSYIGRGTLDWRSADLSISNLRYEDSGFYDLETLINNQQMTKRYKLVVIDKVTKPTISCDINTSESAGTATLLCSLPPNPHQSSLTFQWSTNVKTKPGNVLEISLGGELDDHQYICTVNNTFTKESAVFVAKDCYPETKAQAKVITGVVVAVVVLLLILLVLLFFFRKKVCSNRDKSDLESQSKPGFSKGAACESEETRTLLDRAPTLPSKHTLTHLNQRNDPRLDPSQKDKALMNELSKSIRRRSSSDPEKNIDQDNKALHRPTVPEKSNLVRNFSLQKANENTRPKVIKKQALNDPADSLNSNEVSNDQNSEKNEVEDNTASHPPAVPQKSNLVQDFVKATENAKMQVSNDQPDSGKPNELPDNQNLSEKPQDGLPAASPRFDHPYPDDKSLVDKDKRPDNLDEEDNPVVAEEAKDALPDSEKNEVEDNTASHPPAVPQKSILVQDFVKVTANAKMQVSNDPPDSGKPNELPDNQNSGSKKEESELVKSTPENDAQPLPVAKEKPPLSQNSAESSPKAEEISSDECSMASNESSASFEESENEEQVPPASTPKKADSEMTEKEKPPLSETESEMETRQNK